MVVLCSFELCDFLCVGLLSLQKMLSIFNVYKGILLNEFWLFTADICVCLVYDDFVFRV